MAKWKLIKNQFCFDYQQDHRHSQSLWEKEKNGSEGKDADDNGEEDKLEQEEPVLS